MQLEQDLVYLAGKTEREFVKAEDALTGELSIDSGETLRMHTLSRWIASFRAEKKELRRWFGSRFDSLEKESGLLPGSGALFRSRSDMLKTYGR